MERRKSSSRQGPRPKKRPKVDISKTALGAEPEKRGLKRAGPAAKSPADKRPPAKASVTPSGGGQRELAVNVKTARKRKLSSTLWLQRQLNDPFVARAKAEGYRSRAAYKLIELDEKFGLLKKGARVVDLGAAPGGWTQVAVKKGARVIGIDYLGVPPIPGAEILELDFLDETAPAKLKALLGGKADVVLSDMAAPTTGHKTTDHLRIIALAEAALDFAEDVLAPGGAFVSKVFQGGAEGELLSRLKQDFETVKHAKPKASRSDSAEMYVVAAGFRGRGK
ncbi:MAG: 23S rRNA methyltransferase [Alphaproteobacteria bacterium]|nr:23S rRNA methyltransferase [Alphaproteobacteria bacterium]